MKKYLPLICILTLNSTTSHASIEPKFSVVATTPTSITVPANRHTYVQYTVTNNTKITRTLTIVPIPNVIQVTEDSQQCPNPFVLAQSQSCKLTLYVDGAQLATKYYGGPVVCKTQDGSGKPDPFLCSQPETSMILSIKPAPAVTPTTNKLYVSNWDGNSISLCYIQSGNLTHCLVSAVSNTFANPEALAINDNTLFVANIGGGMSSCIINPYSGELTGCINAALNAPIYAPTGISIFDNGGGFNAYIANSGPESFHQGVTTCDVSGSSLTNCSFTQGDASFSVPSDLAITNGTVYVSNFNSQTLQTTYCTIANPLCTTGSGEGTISGTTTLLNEPEGVFFATLSGSDYAYFTNHGNNTVTLCQVQSPTSFSNCSITSGYFTGFGNLTILSNPLKAFIPSGLKSIAICDVSSVNGSLSNCINSTELNFNNPSGLIIQ